MTQLETRRVRLRHVSPDDYDRLYQIESDSSTLATWRYRGDMPSPADYEVALWKNTQAILAVVRTSDDLVVGYIQSHDAEPRAGHSFFSIYAAADFRGRGLVMEGTLLFGDWVFGNTSIRWLYAHVFDTNLAQFRSAISRGVLEHLGTYRNRVEVAGTPMDVHMLGTSRESWDTCEVRHRLLRSRSRGLL